MHKIKWPLILWIQFLFLFSSLTTELLSTLLFYTWLLYVPLISSSSNWPIKQIWSVWKLIFLTKLWGVPTIFFMTRTKQYLSWSSTINIIALRGWRQKFRAVCTFITIYFNFTLKSSCCVTANSVWTQSSVLLLKFYLSPQCAVRAL